MSKSKTQPTPTSESVSTSAQKYLFLVNGEKGGVGKTQAAKMLTHTLLEKEIDFYPVECDKSNPDLYKACKEQGCKLTFFSGNERKQNKADLLFELALEKHLVVSLPAQVYSPLSSWLKRNNVVEELSKEGVRIVNLFVSNGGAFSIALFQKSLKEWGEAFPHVLVKNLRFRESWERLEEKLEQNGQPIQYLELPIVEYDEQDIIDGDNPSGDVLSFSDAIASDYLGIMQKRRVKKCLSDFRRSFESLGYV